MIFFFLSFFLSLLFDSTVCVFIFVFCVEGSFDVEPPPPPTRFRFSFSLLYNFLFRPDFNSRHARPELQRKKFPGTLFVEMKWNLCVCFPLFHSIFLFFPLSILINKIGRQRAFSKSVRRAWNILTSYVYCTCWACRKTSNPGNQPNAIDDRDRQTYKIITTTTGTATTTTGV